MKKPVRNPRRDQGVVLLTFVAAAGVALLSLHAPNFAVYAVAQLIGACVSLRAFCLLHDLSHGAFFKNRRLNDFFGVLASLICGLPYYPWKKIHIEHHTWAGWQENDPTEDNIEFKDLKPFERFIATWCWRLSLPLIGFSVSVRMFWNLPRLFKLFPKPADRFSFVFNIALIFLTHASLFAIFGLAYAKTYLPAYLLGLFMFDPLMIAQHVGIPLIQPGSREFRPIRAAEQEIFARTLVFPTWFSRHVLLGFNYHSAHHALPTLPGYLLGSVPFQATHQENWLDWLIQAKRTPISKLLEREHVTAPVAVPAPALATAPAPGPRDRQAVEARGLRRARTELRAKESSRAV